MFHIILCTIKDLLVSDVRLVQELSDPDRIFEMAGGGGKIILQKNAVSIQMVTINNYDKNPN